MSENSPKLLRALMDHLRERRVQPGERLPGERVLAQRLGVSRPALREAIAALIWCRVLESRAQAGIYMRKLADESSFETLVVMTTLGEAPSAQEVLETIEIRRVLELQVIEMACVRRTDEDIAQLSAIVDATAATIAAGQNIIDHDQDFHMALVRATKNSVLVRLLNSFYQITLPRRRAYFANLVQARESGEDHRQIVDAIVRRDLRDARRLMESHVAHATVYWGEILEAPREPTTADGLIGLKSPPSAQLSSISRSRSGSER